MPNYKLELNKIGYMRVSVIDLPLRFKWKRDIYINMFGKIPQLLIKTIMYG
jgi:hypothetical protein